MEIFSALLAICGENSPVTGEFPAQRPVTRSFNIFFDLRQNKRLSKQSWGWWFEMPSRPLWRHCNDKRRRSSWSFDVYLPSFYPLEQVKEASAEYGSSQHFIYKKSCFKWDVHTPTHISYISMCNKYSWKKYTMLFITQLIYVCIFGSNSGWRVSWYKFGMYFNHTYQNPPTSVLYTNGISNPFWTLPSC